MPTIRHYKAAIVASILGLIVLITPAVLPRSQTSRAARWVQSASLRTQQAVVCDPDMPQGHGPRVPAEPNVDDVSGFLAFPTFTTDSEAATTALGYSLTAKNKQKTIGKRLLGSSLGWSNLDNYDPQTCATQCDNLPDCKAFNIYYQRSPTVAPSNNGACANPDAMTNILCSFYSTNLKEKDMKKYGEMRGQFKVVIAGSNLFNKVQESKSFWLPRVNLPLGR